MIGLIHPGSTDFANGNYVTANRWAAIFRELGFDCAAESEWSGRPFSMLVALHARRSHASIVRFAECHPTAARIVAAAGTDIYGDESDSKLTEESFRLADRIVVLQPNAIEALSTELRERARVIYQSVRQGRRTAADKQHFEILLLANVRPIKDPLRAAYAAAALEPDSRIRVLHLGRIIDKDLGDTLRNEVQKNPRYRWMGPQPRAKAMEVLARSRLLVCSSLHEGGANAVGEAIAYGVPVLASRIPGSTGLLGNDYPGYFEAGDTAGLTQCMHRAETDPDFYRHLEQAVARRAEFHRPERELASWLDLLRELDYQPT